MLRDKRATMHEVLARLYIKVPCGWDRCALCRTLDDVVNPRSLPIARSQQDIEIAQRDALHSEMWMNFRNTFATFIKHILNIDIKTYCIISMS